jgi:hypothetical protein
VPIPVHADESPMEPEFSARGQHLRRKQVQEARSFKDQIRFPQGYAHRFPLRDHLIGVDTIEDRWLCAEIEHLEPRGGYDKRTRTGLETAQSLPYLHLQALLCHRAGCEEAGDRSPNDAHTALGGIGIALA